MSVGCDEEELGKYIESIPNMKIVCSNELITKSELFKKTMSNIVIVTREENCSFPFESVLFLELIIIAGAGIEVNSIKNNSKSQ